LPDVVCKHGCHNIYIVYLCSPERNIRQKIGQFPCYLATASQNAVSQFKIPHVFQCLMNWHGVALSTAAGAGYDGQVFAQNLSANAVRPRCTMSNRDRCAAAQFSPPVASTRMFVSMNNASPPAKINTCFRGKTCKNPDFWRWASGSTCAEPRRSRHWRVFYLRPGATRGRRRSLPASGPLFSLASLQPPNKRIGGGWCWPTTVGTCAQTSAKAGLISVPLRKRTCTIFCCGVILSAHAAAHIFHAEHVAAHAFH